MTGRGGQDVWVTSFQLHGRNNLDAPIRHVSGLWRSDVTNEEFPIRFVINGQRVRPEETNGIPRKAEFDITSDSLPPSDPAREGIAATRFLRDFASFTLEFEYDGKPFVHHFTNEEIEKQLNAFRHTSLQTAPPTVTQKNTKGPD